MTQGRVGWIDASAGIAGDMLLAACVHAGGAIEQIQDTLDRLELPERIDLTVEKVRRGALDATRVLVRAEQTNRPRRLRDVLPLLERLDEPVASRAASVFRVLADAEAAVHGVPVGRVHFHEVGALDSIADVVGVVTGLTSLGIEHLVCSPIALGGGRIRTHHGQLPVPGPAVLELLRGTSASSFGGPVDVELATPTGVALAIALADEHGLLPAMTIEGVGVGAGTADPDGHPNVCRLVVGSPTGRKTASAGNEVVLEANVDDFDPRLWPGILAELLRAGASDAWLTPIVMKKGRPAQTLSVLAAPGRVETLERIIFTHTTTIGLRRAFVEKVALAREQVSVDVAGFEVRVKLSYLDGQTITATPEFEDIASLATRLGWPQKAVMDAARIAATRLAPMPGR